ncbi:LytTR family DNA-binding domain-containing protein [Flavobacterium difficile]|uniref:LytTR family transcriptional regulator n=1 Tax=Flavobacterium difficile TaxID=2709659 RepID=A0ABX0I8U9_9FLAO|nr:LytTR family DNA-binding domain-containing protein [Flavobacterium difficile]NHM01876.1 LytTR family transcriptional regulator [Flavobacterium difficile]
MLNIFLQPYPFQSNKKTALLVCSSAAAIIFSIFVFFKPFNLQVVSSLELFKIAALYSTVTFFVSIFLSIGLPVFFPALFEEKKWTVLKEIIFLIVIISVIAVVNHLATTLFYQTTISLQGFLTILKYTFSFGIFPVLFSVLLKQQILVKKYKNEAHVINQTIGSAEKVASQKETSQLAVFVGDNVSEQLEIPATSFLCAESDENYTTLYYLEENQIKKILFRITLKKIEMLNKDCAFFYRCHKSFYVNLNQVIQLSGNAQGYKLHFENLPFTVPVSRSLNAIIKQKIAV